MTTPDIRTRYRDLVLHALEGSVYASGWDHGLTFAELQEIGAPKTSGAGALRDVLNDLERASKVESVQDRYRLAGGAHAFLTFPLGRFRPEFRNFDALDFCVEFLAHSWEHTGVRVGSLDEIAAAAEKVGLGRHDMAVAALILTMSGFLDGDRDALRLVDGRESWMLPSQIADQTTPSEQRDRAEVAAVVERVYAVVGTRGSGLADAPAGDRVPPMKFIPRGSTRASKSPLKPSMEIVMPDVADTVPEVFIVHGRDDAAKESVARFVERLALKATILHEQANGGRTVIEKLLEHSSRAKYAIIIVSADDVGALKGDEQNLQPRARQNVVFEWGLFVGRLGRQHVCALLKDNCPVPSDLAGVVYLPFDQGGGWKAEVAKEMKHAGLPIDMNRL